MSKYSVTYGVHTFACFEVEAENEQEAQEKAQMLFESTDIDKQFLSNCTVEWIEAEKED